MVLQLLKFTKIPRNLPVSDAFFPQISISFSLLRSKSNCYSDLSPQFSDYLTFSPFLFILLMARLRVFHRPFTICHAIRSASAAFDPVRYETPSFLPEIRSNPANFFKRIVLPPKPPLCTFGMGFHILVHFSHIQFYTAFFILPHLPFSAA